MISDIAIIVTAAATAVTALFASLQFLIAKRQMDPYISAVAKQIDSGRFILEIWIHPGPNAAYFSAVSVRDSRIGQVDSTYDPWNETVTYGPSHNVRPGKFPLELFIAPSSVSPKPVFREFVLEPRKSQSSFLISIHSRFMCVPVRHRITAMVSSATD